MGSARTAPRLRADRTATLIAASLGFGVIQLDVTVVNVAVKPIGEALGGGTAALQWVVSSYTLIFASLILTGGALGDRFGVRRMLSLGFVLFVAASMACGLAPSIGALIAARALQGVGAALLGACSLALINHTFHAEAERSRAVALWAAGATVALSGGPIVGGVLIAALGWRSIFFINLPIGAVGLALTRRYARETARSADAGVDLPGVLLAVLTIGALAAGLIEGGSVGFGDPFVLGAILVAMLAGAGFVLVEARARQPMLPLALFRRRPFLSPTLLGLAVNVCFYGLLFVFSLFFQREQGFSPLRAGLAFLPMTLVILGANLVTSRIAASIGRRRVLWLGLTLMALGCVGLLPTDASTPFGVIVVPQVLLGGGLGLLVPPMTSALMGSVDRSRSGVAAGTLNTMRQTGSVLGVAIFGSLVAQPDRFVAGFRIALLISLALLAIGALLTRFVAEPVADA